MGHGETDTDRATDAIRLSRGPSEAGALVDDSTWPLEGTLSQVEWAELIRRNVTAEFDRVAAAFRAVAGSQSQYEREETEMMISILEDKRAEVLAIRSAGYFIRSWQEIAEQIQQMMFSDVRCQTIKRARESRQLRTR